MRILNLGCGPKVSTSPEVINVDWSLYLVLKKSNLLRPLARKVLKGERLKRFENLPGNIIVHDLSKGLPFESNSIDVVYHSHVLEHLDRNIASDFLLEIKRVLRKDGIQRIVVPDLEKICGDYIDHISDCNTNPDEVSRHDKYIYQILEQSVRREAAATIGHKPFRKNLENFLFGDARKRGETHQWMYDRLSLTHLLNTLGYKNIACQDYNTSLVPNWNHYGLDRNQQGSEYKPGSLYVEAIK
jgi:SAM-dependent methyltransferase